MRGDAVGVDRETRCMLKASWLRAVGTWCLPPACLLCGARGQIDATGSALDLCAGCEGTLPGIKPIDEAGVRRCGSAAAPWELLVAPHLYAWPIDHCVRTLKFEGDTACGRLLGLLLAQHRRNLVLPMPDLVVPVPLHRARYLERGFNQAAVIGQYAARSLGVPFQARVLERCRATAEQSHLRGAARAGNVIGAFRVRPGTALDGWRIALVDDVLTTGSTAREATRVLRAARAASVELWVAARAEPPQTR